MTFAHLFHADNFLGLFKLETGGTIIGALGMFYSLLQFIFQAILLFPLVFKRNFCPQRDLIDAKFKVGNFSAETQNDLKNFTNLALEGWQNFTQNIQEGLQDVTSTEHSCSSVSKIPFGIILIILLIVNLLSIFIHYKLIKGVEDFDYTEIYYARKFYLFFIIIRIIFIFLGLIWMLFWLRMIYVSILSFVLLIVDYYIFTIIDELYQKYKIPYTFHDATPSTPLKPISEEDIEVIEKSEF